MPIYGWKLNPKAQVVAKAQRLFGKACKVTVVGSRPSPLDCKRFGLPQGTYLVEVSIDGTRTGQAHHRNWRKAYSLLVIEVEKMFELELTRGPATGDCAE